MLIWCPGTEAAGDQLDGADLPDRGQHSAIWMHTEIQRFSVIPDSPHFFSRLLRATITMMMMISKTISPTRSSWLILIPPVSGAAGSGAAAWQVRHC